jgi:dissimilatory sulfite reductase (desulfoviridin) alpha/beta subunit
MKNQIDRTLINAISELTSKEKKMREFKSRVRVKGKLIKKGKTKKGSIKLIVQEKDEKYNFVVIKTHKENLALAEQLRVGSFVSAVGISKFRAIICTQLKQLHKADGCRQTTLLFK